MPTEKSAKVLPMEILIAYAKDENAAKALELMTNLNKIAKANNYTSYLMQEVSFLDGFRQFSINLDILSEFAEKTVAELPGYTPEPSSEFEQLTLF